MNPISLNDPEFAIIFKKEALNKLKQLAAYLDIPEHEMGDVLVKGLHLIDLAKEGRIYIERKNDCFEVDVKKL